LKKKELTLKRVKVEGPKPAADSVGVAPVLTVAPPPVGSAKNGRIEGKNEKPKPGKKGEPRKGSKNVPDAKGKPGPGSGGEPEPVRDRSGEKGKPGKPGEPKPRGSFFDWFPSF